MAGRGFSIYLKNDINIGSYVPVHKCANIKIDA